MRSYVEILKAIDKLEEDRKRTETAYEREIERSQAFERATRLRVQEGSLQVLEALIDDPGAAREVLPRLNEVRESAGLDTITLCGKEEEDNGI